MLLHKWKCNRKLQWDKLYNSKLKNKSILVIGNGATGCDFATYSYLQKAKSIDLIYKSDRFITVNQKSKFFDKVSTGEFLEKLNFLPLCIYWLLLKILFFFIYFKLNLKQLQIPYDRMNRKNISANMLFLVLVTKKKYLIKNYRLLTLKVI